MSVFSKSVKKVVQGALDSFRIFPASIVSAIAFTIVVFVRINLDWLEQESYSFILNCLNWALALGAVFGMTSVTFVRSRYNSRGKFILANIATLAVVIASFLLLYLLGGYRYLPEDEYRVLRGISIARMTVAIGVSLVAFIVFGARPKREPDFTGSLFMTQKSLFVSSVYGGVMMGGLSSVAGAFQALLYNGMSYRVYQYIGAAVGFIAFTIFAGYFPDFSKEEVDERRISAQSQPKFIETLLSYIMIPIVAALTVVFLIWSGRTVFEGVGENFLRLSGIATGYAVVGIWLHIMVTNYKSGIARVYRKIYPLAAIVILGFESWALLDQLKRSGMKTEEYIFTLIWIVAIISVLLLAFKKAKSHVAIAVITSIVAVVSVFPVIGYHQLPPSIQSRRLEEMLQEQGMLQNGVIKPVDEEPERKVRESITDVVMYLSYQNDAKLPDWFDREFGKDSVFRETFGFEQVWPEIKQEGPGYMGVSLGLKPSALDISGYDWAVSMQDMKGMGEVSAEFSGSRGEYEIVWITDYRDGGAPELNIYLDGSLIVQESMDGYMKEVEERYMSKNIEYTEVGVEELSLAIERPEIDLLLVFNSLDIYMDGNTGVPNYGLNIHEVYIDEKN